MLAFGGIVISNQGGFNPVQRDFFVSTSYRGYPTNPTVATTCCFNPVQRDFFVSTPDGTVIQVNTPEDMVSIPSSGIFSFLRAGRCQGSPKSGRTVSIPSSGIFSFLLVLVMALATIPAKAADVSIPSSGIFSFLH